MSSKIAPESRIRPTSAFNYNICNKMVSKTTFVKSINIMLKKSTNLF